MRTGIFLLFLLLAPSAVFSQIAITIKPSHANYMLYDAVYLRLRLKNYSSHPITFGTTAKLHGTLEFDIVLPDGTLAKRAPMRILRDENGVAKAAAPESFLEGMILGPGEFSREITLNLADYYALQPIGIYSIKAVVRHPQLDKAYESNTETFAVRKGIEKWHCTFGIPDYAGKNVGNIRTRNYRLLDFHDGVNMVYYLMIDDARKVYFVKRIAFNLGGGHLEPQYEIDSMGRLHLLVAVTSRVFAYYLYNYDGRLINRVVYIRTTSTPMMVANPADSSVIVSGGRVARKDTDYKEIQDLPLMDEVKADEEVEKAFAAPAVKDDSDAADGKVSAPAQTRGSAVSAPGAAR